MGRDIELITPRTFSGLFDEEHARFTINVQNKIGRGKRSFVICTMIRAFNQNMLYEFSRQANMYQMADHAVKDSLKTLNVDSEFKMPNDQGVDDKRETFDPGRGYCGPIPIWLSAAKKAY